MLFDNNQDLKYTRNIVKSESKQFTSSCLPILESSFDEFNKIFYESSKEILLKETFSKAVGTRNNLFMNEAVDDFIFKIKDTLNGVNKSLDSVFSSYVRQLNSITKKDSDFINKYRDEFVSYPDVKVKMNTYTIEDVKVPNFELLNNVISSYDIDMRKVNTATVRKYKRDEKYFNKFRGNVLGLNKSIKDSDFKASAYKVFRNGKENPSIITLDAKLKFKMLQDIAKTNLEVATLKDDLDKIKAFINLNMKNITNQFNFISKYEDIDKFDYDAYTSFIYNEIDELRQLIRIYQMAFGAKMDAIKIRRDEYINIFKKVITRSPKLKESDYESMLKEDEFILKEGFEISERLFQNSLNNITSEFVEGVYNEDTSLLTEGILESIKDIASKIKEQLLNFFNKFKNHVPKSCGKYEKEREKLIKAASAAGIPSEVEDAMQCYFCDTQLMVKILSSFKPISQIENDLSEIMASEDEFYKRMFPDIYKNYANSENNWDEAIKITFRGEKLNDAKKSIPRALDFTSYDFYVKNRDTISKSYNMVIKECDYLKKRGEEEERKKVTQQAEDKKNAEQNKTESYNFFTEDVELFSEEDAVKELEKKKEAMTKLKDNLQKGEFKGTNLDRNADDFVGKLGGSQEGSTTISNMNNYIHKLAKIQGYACSTFNQCFADCSEILSTFIKYLNQSIQKTDKTIEEERAKKEEEKKKKEQEAKAKKNK